MQTVTEVSATVSAPIVSEVDAEVSAVLLAVDSLTSAIRQCGPESIRKLFCEGAKHADLKTGTLDLNGSLIAASIFSAQSPGIPAAVGSARKAFRDRLGTADAVAKDRFPYQGKQVSGFSGLSTKYSARFVAGLKAAVAD